MALESLDRAEIQIHSEWLYTVASAFQVFAGRIAVTPPTNQVAAFEQFRHELPSSSNRLEELVVDGLIYRGLQATLRDISKAQLGSSRAQPLSPAVARAKRLIDER